jgi:hypothetical protein
MKHHHQYHHDHNQHPVNATPPAATVAPKQDGGIAFGPSHDDVAKRAYSIYVSQGSRPGCDIQHWQEAEAQLVEEHNHTADRNLSKPNKN